MSDQVAGKQERYGIQINIRVIMKVDILGQEYEICMDVSELEDTLLADCDGYTDRSTKRIIIAREPPECELKDFNAYKKVVVRHELIHAFLYESGLDANSIWHLQKDESHPEQMVEWLAMQFPKMLKIFQELDVI